MSNQSANTPGTYEKAKIKLNSQTIKNLLRGWLLRPNLGRADDYFCLGITSAVSSYTTGQFVRNVHVYEAEVLRLWGICCHMVLAARPDVLYRDEKFFRRAVRWILKEFPDEMRPFLGQELLYSFNNVHRDILKLQNQRVSKSQPRQSDFECCVDYFCNVYNRKGDPETTKALEACIVDVLEHADSY